MKSHSQGHKLRQISEQLCLSSKTVSTYRTRVLRKLAVETDVALTHMALRMGLIEPRRSA